MDVRPVRVYADTSIFGGVFDDEFAGGSSRFLDAVREGRLQLVVSKTVTDELIEAPTPVRALFDELLPQAEVIEVPDAAIALQAEYLRHGIVTARWAADALHVAAATVAGCAMIVSWNFTHIVNFRRIPLYNAVNRLNGYGEIAIYSPLEVKWDEDEQEGL